MQRVNARVLTCLVGGCSVPKKNAMTSYSDGILDVAVVGEEGIEAITTTRAQRVRYMPLLHSYRNAAFSAVVP